MPADAPSRQRVAGYSLLLAVLFVSGIAGLINQIGWQRAVKVYLANSETLSSMIVVLVFMLGLGVGSMVAARYSSRLRNPLLVLAGIELLLATVNLVLIAVFGNRLRELASAFQSAALASGIPSTVPYAALSFAVLLLPCFLMGLTIPFAGEAAQRQLGVSRQLSVTHFFFVNTIGAVAGTLLCGFVLLPVFGQRIALSVAASANLLAAGTLAALAMRTPAGADVATVALSGPPPAGSHRFRDEELMAFILGLVALSYEMYLFRILSLAYTPLPWIFSLVLCFYLLFWSLGVKLSETLPERTSLGLLLTAMSLAVIPFVLAHQRSSESDFPIWGPGLVYFLPCLGFGLLFGQFIGRYARNWGHDLGKFNALNTAGSCVGILLTTLVLFEMSTNIDAWILVAGMLGPLPYFWFQHRNERDGIPSWTMSSLSRLGLLVVALLMYWRLAEPRIQETSFEGFYGRTGVVEIASNGNVLIDGLWHSVLFRDDNLPARRNPNVRRKTLIAVLPYLAHRGSAALEALNIGMGTGATARVLAKADLIRSVDTYEIVTTLQRVIARYPEESLGHAKLEKVNVHWGDARTGLMTNPRKYDLITQSPMYLKQSGSSLLLSVEYFALLRSRLKEGGVVGIYSNAQGNEDQAMLVRNTVRQVFPFYESFDKGYFLLASDRPLDVSRAQFESKLQAQDGMTAEIRLIGIEEILRGIDNPRLDWAGTRYVITDDHPLVEYPATLRWLASRDKR
jgi:spermidine synthase